jgi:hypothetical protein
MCVERTLRKNHDNAIYAAAASAISRRYFDTLRRSAAGR